MGSALRVPEAMFRQGGVGAAVVKDGAMQSTEPSGDELRAEYDETLLRGGVRGKYVERYRAGTNLVLLDPDVATAFPTDESVNEALRSGTSSARNSGTGELPMHEPSATSR